MYGYSNNFSNNGYGGYSNIGYDMYRPQTQQIQMPQTVQAPTPQNQQIIWVQGEAGAKSYLVARGETAVLWDSENPYIYIKSADMS